MGKSIIRRSEIDLHMHSNCSDGTDTPEQLLEKVRESSIRLFSLTDHDALKGCLVIRDCLKEGDPYFLTGIEFSCKDEEGKYHILGYGYDLEAEPIRSLVEKSHGFRMEKFHARIKGLSERFGFTFPDSVIRNFETLDNPGKPHLGYAMVDQGYAESKELAINKYINEIRVKSQYLRPEEAIQAILQSGGIPVLAHPAYGNGDQVILGDDMDRRLKRLISFGLQGVEGFYSGFTPKIVGETLTFAEKYGLYVTAGSDHHGGYKIVQLGDTGPDLPGMRDDGLPEGLRRFLEATEQRVQKR